MSDRRAPAVPQLLIGLGLLLFGAFLGWNAQTGALNSLDGSYNPAIPVATVIALALVVVGALLVYGALPRAWSQITKVIPSHRRPSCHNHHAPPKAAAQQRASQGGQPRSHDLSRAGSLRRWP